MKKQRKAREWFTYCGHESWCGVSSRRFRTIAGAEKASKGWMGRTMVIKVREVLPKRKSNQGRGK
jgi:hypothetical protein